MKIKIIANRQNINKTFIRSLRSAFADISIKNPFQKSKKEEFQIASKK